MKNKKNISLATYIITLIIFAIIIGVLIVIILNKDSNKKKESSKIENKTEQVNKTEKKEELKKEESKKEEPKKTESRKEETKKESKVVEVYKLDEEKSDVKEAEPYILLEDNHFMISKTEKIEENSTVDYAIYSVDTDNKVTLSNIKTQDYAVFNASNISFSTENSEKYITVEDGFSVITYKYLKTYEEK